MSSIYINKTYIYSKRNIAGFEFLDRDDKDFRKILHYEEAIDFVKYLDGEIDNAKVFVKGINSLGKEIYDIKADGKLLTDFLDKKMIFNLSVLYNERDKYYKEYRELFDKFICVVSF